MAASVGMRGSSQPDTTPSSTRRRRYRLDMMVRVRFSRANSICRGGRSNPASRTTQSYSGRWISYSSEHREWVTPSSASCSGCWKSYIG
jgi:hypothetical protein